MLDLLTPSEGPDRLDGDPYAGRSKLDALLGETVWEEIRGRTVIDYGCGIGRETIELVEHGAQSAIGLDIQERWLVLARELAQKRGLLDRCTFATTATGPTDVIVSLDSFEHFADPAAVLVHMYALLRPGGLVLASFGPTWYHPLGGHLFSVFPWSHLIVTEQAQLRWRSKYRHDGATRFSEVEGGLNQMTISRFERLVAESPFRKGRIELVPIRRLRHAHARLTREFTTAVVRCRLVREQ